VSVHGVPKEARVFEGRQYVLEESIKGDVAFVRAWKVDEVGNCVFRWGWTICVSDQNVVSHLTACCRYTSHNFSSAMAKNAKLTIVEARHLSTSIIPI
jgi:3-oxoacid CoA-transferase